MDEDQRKRIMTVFDKKLTSLDRLPSIQQVIGRALFYRRNNVPLRKLRVLLGKEVIEQWDQLYLSHAPNRNVCSCINRLLQEHRKILFLKLQNSNKVKNERERFFQSLDQVFDIRIKRDQKVLPSLLLPVASSNSVPVESKENASTPKSPKTVDSPARNSDNYMNILL
jgi:hypothetical protein